MADNIFVGSVSVGVVPDLKGFNTKLRAELVPSANRIGQEMGTAMTKGISDNLGVTKVSLAKMRKSITDSMKDIKVEVGVDVTKVALDELKIKISDKLKDIKIFVNVDVSKVQLDLVRAKIIDGLSGIKVNIELGVTKTSIAKTRAEIREGLKGINVSVGVGGGGGGGRGVGGAAAAAGGGGFIGGLGALIKALPGGTSGSIGAVPAPILGGAAAAGLAALPFLAQMLAGFIPAIGGGAIAGLGVAGAFGVGGTTQQQVAQSRAASQAADARVKAAQARLASLGGGGATPLQRQSAQLGLEAAQQRLTQARGGTSAAAILSAEAGVAGAQDRLNKLQGVGKVSTAQLQSAEAQLATARASQAKASQAYQKAQADQITAGQQRVRDSFKQLALDAQTSLSQIGAPMVPVMEKILKTVDKTMKALTPVFENAVGIIAGPFQTFADTIIKSLADPQVTSAITAVAGAFADVMVAFTPDIPGIINSFADAIERIAGAVSKNPKAFADFLNFFFQLGIMIINAIAFLADFADWIEKHWNVLQWIVTPAIAAIALLIKHWGALQHNTAVWFDRIRHGVATQWDLMWQDTIGRAIRAQKHLETLISGWLHNVAHWFDVARHAVASAWNKMWDETIGRAVRGWQSIYTNVWVPVRDFFTKTLPGWFQSAVTAVGHVWDDIKGAISGPVAWVGKHILLHLFNAIDDITNFVGLHKPLQAASDVLANLPGKAVGGIITQGTTATADDVLIRASRGETMVSAAHSKLPFMQAAFSMAGVPGYQGGGGIGLKSPNIASIPADLGTGIGPSRALMESWFGRIADPSNEVVVKFAGADVMINKAVSGTVTQIGNEIAKSDPHYVDPSQTGGFRTGIGASTSNIPYSMHQLGLAIDVNWNQNPYLGNKGTIVNHPGVIEAFKRHGWFWGGNWGPGGRDQMHFQLENTRGGAVGGGGIIGGIIRSLKDIFGGLGATARIAMALATGNTTAASNALTSLIGKGAGGATGQLASTLLSLPPKLIIAAVKHLVNAVKSFASSQQSTPGGGIPGVPPAHGSALAAQNFARTHLAQFGWTMAEWPSLLALWQGESGWNANAVNPSSGAYGIPQALGHGHPFNLGDYANQILWGMSYIKNNPMYGSPSRAYSAWLGRSPHWYASGTGGAAPGWAWVGEKGPELVNFHGGETVMPNGDFGGYQGGTVSAAVALANRNKAAAQALANQNKATAAAIAAYNRMARAGASLVALIAKITPKTTASVFASDQAKFLADLRLYFTPSTAKYRSQLVIKQITEMENLQTHIKTLSTNIANASAYQKQELAHLQSTGGIGAIGIQGVGAAGGRSILAGLTRQLTDMRSFGYAIRDLSRAGASQAVLKTVAAMDPAGGTVYARKMISALHKMHALKLSPEMINQLIALGPDAALAYANAIQAAGPSVLKQIKSTEAVLAATTLGTSRGIAAVVSGGAYNTGVNFVAGLKSQEKSLENQFAHLGKVLGQEAIKWMHVPPNKRPYGYQHGGWINEPISGYGAYTGSYYTFAEAGREYVLPEGQIAGRGVQGDSYHAHFDGLTGAAIESHVRTAFQAMSMQQGRLQRQGRRF